MEFPHWLARRTEEREKVSLRQLTERAGGPQRCSVAVVDLLEGFSREGPLASSRIEKVIGPTVSFLEQCHRLGWENFFFPSDAHVENSPEFEAFPPHCLSGTSQSQIVSEVLELEFAHLFHRVDKRSISSLMETELGSLLRQREVTTIVCVGDCTDLCLYHLATGLRFLANSLPLEWEIVVPQDLVATYDLSLEAAAETGALPHPGDFLSDVFLYHMELLGVKVVGGFTP